MSGVVDTSELRKLAADLGTAAARTGARAAAVVRTSAGRVNRAGAAAAPRGATHRLSESIGIDMYGDGRSLGMTAVIGPTEFYGRFVEYGTAMMAARPFMGPALAAEEPAFIAAMEAIAGGVLDS